jgi:hypothetical protein
MTDVAAPVLEPIRNPFKDRTLHNMFKNCVRLYDERHRDLIYPDGRRCRGNSGATYFWRGYDGVARKNWDAASRKMIAWACYRAGEAVRKREEAAGRPLILV